MLQRLADHIAASYGRAAECKERAASATHPETKEEYVRLARGWVHLARSYEFVESLERFLLDAHEETSFFEAENLPEAPEPLR
jgi:hypothetical protein